MPTYQYACTVADCGHQFERVQAFSDNALTECPVCAGRLRKVWGSIGVVFKGSGFYRNDSRSSPATGKSEAGSSDKGSKSESASGDAKAGGKTGKDSSGSGSSGSGSGSAKGSGGTSGSTSDKGSGTGGTAKVASTPSSGKSS